MCYSAPTSFAAASALVSAGAYCLWETGRKQRRFLPLAALPILFGVQQLAEGFVWLKLQTGAVPPAHPAVQTFLAFALAFWPIWIPLTMLGILPRQRPALLGLLALGIAVAFALYYPILTRPDRFLDVSVRHHSIRYDFTRIPILERIPESLMRALYAVTIVVPLCLGDRKLKLFGLSILASLILSWICFEYAFASVWCLFAALLSIYIALYVRSLPRLAQSSPQDPARPS
jgi:hypothetical protein